ncbi:large ribosomal subunit protein bL28 [Rugosimonospora acidiphila]
MSRRCEITGAGPGPGNAVSRSSRRTTRRWNPMRGVRL